MTIVTSADGTTIAYESYGQGPPVAIVGGATADRGAGRALAQALAARGCTGITYDRRGRGDSTDTLPYAVEREIEDLAAVLAAHPGPGYAHGLSSGGCLVLRALAAGLPVRAASVFEPPYRTPEAPLRDRYLEILDERYAAGDLAGMLRHFQVAAVGLPEEAAAQFVQAPEYARVLATAPTLRYDARCCGEGPALLPELMLAGIETPVLALCSSGTMIPWLHDNPARVAACLPHGTSLEVAGGFHDAPADAVADALVGFFRTAAGSRALPD